MKKVTIFFKPALIAAVVALVNCQANTVPESEAEQNLILGLASGQALEAGKDFALNGQWNAFTGSGTTAGSVESISAKSGTGVWISDAACLSRYLVSYYDNGAGIVITQNPESGGAFNDGGTGGSCGAFSDSNKGKYNKVVFFSDTFNDQNVIWSCTVAFGQNSLQEALEASDTSDRTNPESSGCGGFSWSRLERR